MRSIALVGALAGCIGLAGCGGGGGSATAPAFPALLTQAAAIARAANPAALLLEARASDDRGHTQADVSRWRFLFSRSADPSADAGVVMVTWDRGAWGAPVEVTVPIDTAQQAPITGAAPISFEDALRRLRVAGCDLEYDAVRFWQPVGASQSEPLFDFELPRLGGSVVVGARSGAVSGFPLGGGEEPADVYSSLMRDVLAAWPKAVLVNAVATYGDGPEGRIVTSWELAFMSARAYAKEEITISWSAATGYGPLASGPLGRWNCNPILSALPDPATRWAQLMADPSVAALFPEGVTLAKGTLRFPPRSDVQGYSGTQPYYLYSFASRRGGLVLGALSGDVRLTGQGR